jgi:hypothetical protein
MRKLLWGCGAAAVAALLLGYMAYEYAHDHPNSWLGRWLVTAHHVAATEAHAVRATRQTAEVALHTAEAVLHNGTACEDGGNCPAQEAPAPEEACPVPPAVLPGGVVMHEDGTLPAQPMPPVRDVIGALPFLGSADEFQEARMPAVEDGATKMPRVPEDSAGGRPKVNVPWFCPVIPF